MFTRRPLLSSVFSQPRAVHLRRYQSQPMQSITMPTSESSPNLHDELSVETFIQEFVSQQANHSPSTSLQYAITRTIAQAEARRRLSGPFDQAVVPEIPRVGFQELSGPLPRQSILSILYIATKFRINKFTSIFSRLFTEITEITIGSGSFSVTLNTGYRQDCCYVEHVLSRERWRAAVCPSGVSLRLVLESELTYGCRQLISVAGCSLVTAASTPQQNCQSLEIPSRSLRNVMQSLGFCVGYCGVLYFVYASRLGRHIKVTVSVVPKVDENGDNHSDIVNIQSSSLLCCVRVVENESVTSVVHQLKTLSDNSLITREGRRMIKKKLKGHNSLILM